jgi:hypothetical protein
MEAIFRKCTAHYVRSVEEDTVHVIYCLLIYFILPAFFVSIRSVWPPSYLPQSLVLGHALGLFSVIFMILKIESSSNGGS